CLDRVLDVLDFGNLYVAYLTIHLLDSANVNSIDDVASVRIDRNRTTRTFPFQSLHRTDETFAVGLPIRFFQGLVNYVHSVVSADREEVGIALELRIVGGH